MKCLPLHFFIYLALVPFLSYAQSPPIEWQKVIGNENGDYPSKIITTKDGGYVIVAYREGIITNNNNGTYHEDRHAWVIRMDKDGNILWENYLIPYSHSTPDVKETADGGFIVAISSYYVECGNFRSLDYYAFKLSSAGIIEWQQHYGGSLNDYAYSVDIVPGGGYIIAGHTNSVDGDVSYNHGIRDYWIVRINELGELLWEKSYGGTGDDEAMDIKATPDKGFIITGITSSTDGDVKFNHGKTDIWLVKISSTGNLEWERSLGGSLWESSYAVELTNTGFICVGNTSSSDGDVVGKIFVFRDAWVVAVSNAGNIEWQKCYGGELDEEAFDIVRVPSGGYAIAGYSSSSNGDVTCNKGQNDIWIFRINDSGSVLWQKSFGGKQVDNGSSVAVLKDGSFILTGFTCSIEVPGYTPHTTYEGTCTDILVVKLGTEFSNPQPLSIKIDPSTINICAGLPVALTAKAFNAGVNATYQWFVNGVATGTNSPTLTTATLKENDVVKCLINNEGSCENNGGTAYDEVTIKANTNVLQPVISIKASHEVLCNCDPVRFEATVENMGSYPLLQWRINDKPVGNNRSFLIAEGLKHGDVVTCEYLDRSVCIENGKAISNPIQISTGGSVDPAVTITSSSLIDCVNKPVVFKTNVVNAGIRPTYKWMVNGTEMGTLDSLLLAQPVNGDKISCTVFIDPEFTCGNSTSVQSNEIIVSLKNINLTQVSIDAADIEICSGSELSASAIVRDAGLNPKIQWFINGQYSGQDSKAFKSRMLADGDNIFCVVTPGNDVCNPLPVRSDQIKIKVSSVPVVTVSPTDTIAGYGAVIRLNGMIQGPYTSFNWEPLNMLEDGTDIQPYTRPLKEEQQFTLIVNNDGCLSSAVARINIKRPYTMPTAFSPNGDGINDVFRIPEGVQLQLQEFSVFDRWGNRIFSTKDINRGWDGKINGKFCDPGTFIYLIRGTTEQGTQTRKGSFLLLK